VKNSNLPTKVRSSLTPQLHEVPAPYSDIVLIFKRIVKIAILVCRFFHLLADIES
jgi:hypothetical protein